MKVYSAMPLFAMEIFRELISGIDEALDTRGRRQNWPACMWRSGIRDCNGLSIHAASACRTSLSCWLLPAPDDCSFSVPIPFCGRCFRFQFFFRVGAVLRKPCG